MQQTTTIREAVGVFTAEAALQDAIDVLLSFGFDRAELSLLAAEKTVERELGHRYLKVSELEDNPAVPHTCYVPTESIGEAEGGVVGSQLYVGCRRRGRRRLRRHPDRSHFGRRAGRRDE